MSIAKAPARKVACRPIEERDHDAVAALLSRGFPGRSHAYWLRGLQRLSTRDLPPDVPRYGYLLESDGTVRGVLLLIYSAARAADGTSVLRCNLSSWFVDPDVRGYAGLLTSMAQRNRTTNFVNLTAAPNTWPIIEAQGFKPAGAGLFFAVPVLSAGGGRIERIKPSTTQVVGLDACTVAMLRSHAELGCTSLVCRIDGGAIPVILAPFHMRSGRVPTPAMRLVHVPSLHDLRRIAGALGRYLALRGRPVVLISADGPVPGLVGTYTARRGRRYVRGPHPPCPYDLTESEFVYFGG